MEGCISDLSDLEKMDQKSGKAAGKEGDMDDCRKKMGDVDELTVKMKTLEVGNNIKTSNIRQDIIRNFFDSSDDDDEKIKGMELGGSSSMKTNAGEDPEDWIDAFARPETKSVKDKRNKNLLCADCQDKSRDDLGKGTDFIYIPGGYEDHPGN